MSSKKRQQDYITPMNKQDVTQIRDEILMAALPDIAFDGWHWETIQNAAQKAGHSTNTGQSVFPGKMIDVLDHFADLADRKMLEALEDTPPEDLRIRDRIRTALLARYEWLAPHKEALRQSTQFWMIPTRKPRAAKIIWRTADRIWEWAGDTATDYNRYTKRGLLSGIIASTTLVFINDPSDDMEKTQSFLDRRIENVMQFGKVTNKFKKKPA